MWIVTKNVYREKLLLIRAHTGTMSRLKDWDIRAINTAVLSAGSLNCYSRPPGYGDLVSGGKTEE